MNLVEVERTETFNPMKYGNQWLNSLATVAGTILPAIATTSLVWTTPTLANEVAATDYFEGQQSIELYVPPPESNRPGVCASFVTPAIDSIIGKYPNNWGILVESLDTGTVIYAHNADKHFIPASNIKLFTTAAALQRLNPNGTIRSKSVKDWITVTNLRSNNWYADTLLKYIGGAGVAKSALAQLGINPNGFRLADGSGLSRHNAATPRSLVQTLRVMYYAPGKEVFQASLPVAGMSGTLTNRMKHTPVQGVVYAKTGTLRGVRALSGYMNHPQYGILLFSILANNPYQSGDSLVSSIDRIVLQLNNLIPCN